MKKEYSIRKEMKKLAAVRGSGTELISLYIPPGTQISDVTSKLREEHGQAANIKSKSTRTNVQTAIDKIVQYLRLYKQPPNSGLAIFAGNVSNEQSKPDVQLFSIEPPLPIKTNLYRCDSTFLLEPLEAMADAKDMYALVIMDGRDATVGLLKGNHFEKEKSIHSFAHAKIKKGGQSMNRYQRLIEESIEDYYKRIGNTVDELYAKHSFKIKGLIVGGPGPAKENFVKAKTLNYQIKVLGVFDTGYTDEGQGVNELLERSKEVLAEQEAIQERNLMERFMTEVGRKGLAVSGYHDVKMALQSNNAAKILVSEGIELKKVQYKCSKCGTEITEVEQGNLRKEKHDDGGTWEIVKQTDAVEELLDMADQMNIDVISISDDSQYGKQLLLGFGGIAAMLKYKP
jgi:peptide chain release factor subunit 1